MDARPQRRQRLHRRHDLSRSSSINANTSLGTGTLKLNGGANAYRRQFHESQVVVVVAVAPQRRQSCHPGRKWDPQRQPQLNYPGFLTLNGAISGTGGLIEDGFPGYTILAGAASNTYTGATTIIGGTLKLNKTQGLNAVASPISLAGGSFPTLTFATSFQLPGTVTVTLGADSSLSTGGTSQTFAAVSGIGSLSDTSNNGGIGLTLTGSGASVLTGAVSGNGVLAYNGAGSMTLGGDSSSFSGQLVA